MSQYVFNRNIEWKKWPLNKKVKAMQDVVTHHNDERSSLINSKHYFGFGYCNHIYTRNYYINEEIREITSIYRNITEIKTVINLYIGYFGIVTITKERVTDPKLKVLSKEILESNKDTKCMTFRITKKPPSGTQVWKCSWNTFPAIDVSPMYFPWHNDDPYFDCLICAINYFFASSPKALYTYPTRYNNKTVVPSLKQLSSFILLHSHFPFIDTILKDVLPKSLFKWMSFEYPAQMNYLKGLFTHLGVCTE